MEEEGGLAWMRGSHLEPHLLCGAPPPLPIAATPSQCQLLLYHHCHLLEIYEGSNAHCPLPIAHCQDQKLPEQLSRIHWCLSYCCSQQVRRSLCSGNFVQCLSFSKITQLTPVHLFISESIYCFVILQKLFIDTLFRTFTNYYVQPCPLPITHCPPCYLAQTDAIH